MIPDGLQHFLGHFWNFQECHKISTHGPLTDHRNTLKIHELWKYVIKHVFCEFGNQSFIFFETPRADSSENKMKPKTPIMNKIGHKTSSTKPNK